MVLNPSPSINPQAFCDMLPFSKCCYTCITSIFKSFSLVLIFGLKSEFSFDLKLRSRD